MTLEKYQKFLKNMHKFDQKPLLSDVYEIFESHTNKILAAIKMTKRSKHVPASMSGGEKQRIAVGRALANNPSIILADEPTGNLDSQTGEEIINLLKEISKNRAKTLIIVTHDKEIADMADNIINIRDGKITEIKEI